MKCIICRTRGTKKNCEPRTGLDPLALRYRTGTRELPHPLSDRETRDKPGHVLGQKHMTRCIYDTRPTYCYNSWSGRVQGPLKSASLGFCVCVLLP